MKKTSSLKWIFSFLCLLLAIVLLLSTVAFIVDPFMQFRVKDNTYMLNGRYVCSGLIRNYDYNTLILGSSMIQNFNMDQFRQDLGVAPLHIGLGGLTITEMCDLLTLAYDAQKADSYYVCIDLMVFTNNLEQKHLPQHLMNRDLLSTLRYLLSYEVWFGFLPIDIAFMTLDQLGINLPTKFAYSRSIDNLENWQLDYPVWGEKTVLDNYKNNQYSVSYVDSENLYQTAIANIDKLFNAFNFTKGEHIFFFPPYSSLCWSEYENRGQFNTYLQIKRYFIEKAMQYDVTVYDFQSAEFTMDLDNYKDSTHYMAHINDWMVQCFVDKSYVVNNDNVLDFEKTLMENTQKFREKYADLFN